MSNQIASTSQKNAKIDKPATTSDLVPVSVYNSQYQKNNHTQTHIQIQTLASTSSFNPDDQQSLSLEIIEQKGFKYAKNLKENYYTFKWLQNECAKAKIELETSKSNETHLRTELGSLQRICRSQKQFVLNLKRELKELQANSVPKSQYDQFLKQNRAVVINSRKLRWQNVQLLKQKNQNHSLDDENQKLKLNLETTIQKLKAENKNLLLKTANRKDELEKVKSNHEEVTQKLEHKLEKKNDEIEQLREKNGNLQKDLNQMNNTLTYELEQADREKCTLVQVGKTVKKLGRKIEIQKHEIKRKTQQISDLKKKLITMTNDSESKKNIEDENMKEKRQQHQEKVRLVRTQVESLKNFKPELMRNIRFHEETEDLIKKQLKDFEGKFMRVENKSELEQSKKQIEECLKKLKVKDEKILAQNGKIISSQNCIDALRSTILKLESDIQRKDKNGVDRDAEIRKLLNRLEFVQKENQKQNLTIVHLQKELEETKAHFLTFSQQKPPDELLWVRDTEIVRLNCIIKDLYDAISKKTEEINENNKTIEELRSKLHENTTSAEQVRREQDKLIVSLNDELNILKKNYDKLSRAKSITNWGALSTFQIGAAVPGRRSCGLCGSIIN
ncbi:unnamed protein product [Orchesella dallaii]|uniref:Uncharacterized protein n=1 Tax=Orchesella dallaii TaxID=48710 RepID=A0ABP1RHT6_9HEXA